MPKESGVVQMKCSLCGGAFNEPATYINFQNAQYDYLNKKFVTCCKCGYSILKKAYSLDPIFNLIPRKGVIAMACGGKKSGGKKPTKKK
jgi:hypothetical protein